jgi:C-terminal processing protease CtpA/Prc
LTGNIGCVRVRSFLARDQKAWATAAPEDLERLAEPDLRAIGEAMDAVNDTNSLVLDLRGNAGGSDFLGEELARRLVPRGSIYYSLSSRIGASWSAPAPVSLERPSNQLTPHKEVYTRPLAVLIDEGSFSATDNLVACLRDNRPNTIIVGRPTGGGTGAPRPFRLPRTGATVKFCTMRVYRPKGGLIDGRGTAPDIPVRWQRSNYETGRDPDLEAATDWLTRQSGNRTKN